MARRANLIRSREGTQDIGFFLVCSGYLVERGRVLLVHHNRFDKWVPPGGHLDPGETFAAAAAREFSEESGLQVEALSAQPVIHPGDPGATPEPAPFYVDIERPEGFPIPALTQFFYVKRVDGARGRPVEPQLAEVHDAAWFGLHDLDALPTFEQVRSLARFALLNYPIEAERATAA
ncbi:NUDIX domain-containing protein [Actinomadura sp. KC216]|uniref:NUDIX hydrolase n=1 Tax=Actinomadura sp. KC216 TaxID=2530370 RepID=UPI001A9FF0A9|nr:NUDIX domain-containing protein [Actinomadura sp. KC216]